MDGISLCLKLDGGGKRDEETSIYPADRFEVNWRVV